MVAVQSRGQAIPHAFAAGSSYVLRELMPASDRLDLCAAQAGKGPPSWMSGSNLVTPEAGISLCWTMQKLVRIKLSRIGWNSARHTNCGLPALDIFLLK